MVGEGLQVGPLGGPQDAGHDGAHGGGHARIVNQNNPSSGPGADVLDKLLDLNHIQAQCAEQNAADD